VRIPRIVRHAVQASLVVTAAMVSLVSPSTAAAGTTDLESGPSLLAAPTLAATTVLPATGSNGVACKVGANCPPKHPPKPPPPPPVAVTCESFDPAYIIFEDINRNGSREGNEPIHVEWGFHIDWCYSADSDYPSAPVFAYTAFARDPLIAPGTRWEQSGPPTHSDQRSWSDDRFLETVTVTWGTKTFSTVILTPFGELRVSFHPVIQLWVDGFGNEQACDLSKRACSPILH
jgi:hypothetical protein